MYIYIIYIAFLTTFFLIIYIKKKIEFFKIYWFFEDFHHCGHMMANSSNKSLLPVPAAAGRPLRSHTEGHSSHTPLVSLLPTVPLPNNERVVERVCVSSPCLSSLPPSTLSVVSVVPVVPLATLTKHPFLGGLVPLTNGGIHPVYSTLQPSNPFNNSFTVCENFSSQSPSGNPQLTFESSSLSLSLLSSSLSSSLSSPQQPPIRMIVADPHPIIRQGAEKRVAAAGMGARTVAMSYSSYSQATRRLPLSLAIQQQLASEEGKATELRNRLGTRVTECGELWKLLHTARVAAGWFDQHVAAERARAEKLDAASRAAALEEQRLRFLQQSRAQHDAAEAWRLSELVRRTNQTVYHVALGNLRSDMKALSDAHCSASARAAQLSSNHARAVGAVREFQSRQSERATTVASLHDSYLTASKPLRDMSKQLACVEHRVECLALDYNEALWTEKEAALAAALAADRAALAADRAATTRVAANIVAVALANAIAAVSAIPASVPTYASEARYVGMAVGQCFGEGGCEGMCKGRCVGAVLVDEAECEDETACGCKASTASNRAPTYAQHIRSFDNTIRERERERVRKASAARQSNAPSTALVVRKPQADPVDATEGKVIRLAVWVPTSPTTGEIQILTCCIGWVLGCAVAGRRVTLADGTVSSLRSALSLCKDVHKHNDPVFVHQDTPICSRLLTGTCTESVTNPDGSVVCHRGHHTVDWHLARRIVIRKEHCNPLSRDEAKLQSASEKRTAHSLSLVRHVEIALVTDSMRPTVYCTSFMNNMGSVFRVNHMSSKFVSCACFNHGNCNRVHDRMVPTEAQVEFDRLMTGRGACGTKCLDELGFVAEALALVLERHADIKYYSQHIRELLPGGCVSDGGKLVVPVRLTESFPDDGSAYELLMILKLVQRHAAMAKKYDSNLPALRLSTEEEQWKFELFMSRFDVCWKDSNCLRQLLSGPMTVEDWNKRSLEKTLCQHGHNCTSGAHLTESGVFGNGKSGRQYCRKDVFDGSCSCLNDEKLAELKASLMVDLNKERVCVGRLKSVQQAGDCADARLIREAEARMSGIISELKKCWAPLVHPCRDFGMLPIDPQPVSPDAVTSCVSTTSCVSAGAVDDVLEFDEVDRMEAWVRGQLGSDSSCDNIEAFKEPMERFLSALTVASPPSETRSEFAELKRLVAMQVKEEQNAVKEAEEAKAREAAIRAFNVNSQVKSHRPVSEKEQAKLDKGRAETIQHARETGASIRSTPESVMLMSMSHEQALQLKDARDANRLANREVRALRDREESGVRPDLDGHHAVVDSHRTQREEQKHQEALAEKKAREENLRLLEADDIRNKPATGETLLLCDDPEALVPIARRPRADEVQLFDKDSANLVKTRYACAYVSDTDSNSDSEEEEEEEEVVPLTAKELKRLRRQAELAKRK